MPRSRDEYGDNDDDEYDDRSRRRGWDDDRDRTDDARGRTLGPAVGLIVAAALGILGNAGWTALNLAAPKPPPPANATPERKAGYEAGLVVGQWCPGVFGLLCGALLVLGAVGLRNGNRGLAITGCVVGFLPCHLGWLVSLPCGIWALTVMNDPEVQRAYRRRR